MLIPSIPGGAGFSSQDSDLSVFKVSDYMTGPRRSGTGAGSVDDWPAFRSCVDACFAAGGGVVLIDLPIWFLSATGGDWNGTALGASNVIFKGYLDAAPVTIDSFNDIVMTLSNLDFLGFEDIIFLGGSDGGDCQTVVETNVWRAYFHRCQFVNVASVGGMLTSDGTWTTLRNCRIGGCGTANGPGLIHCRNTSQLLMEDCFTIDYGMVSGRLYVGKTNPNLPWVYYTGNQPAAGHQQAPSQIGLVIRDSFFDEGRQWTVLVEKENPAGLPMRSVILENVINNLWGGTGGGGYSISGVDTVLINGGEFAWAEFPKGVVLRDVRHGHIERLNNKTGGTVEVDADSTVTFLKLLESPNMTMKAGSNPGLLVHQFNGVDI